MTDIWLDKKDHLRHFELSVGHAQAFSTMPPIVHSDNPHIEIESCFLNNSHKTEQLAFISTNFRWPNINFQRQTLP